MFTIVRRVLLIVLGFTLSACAGGTWMTDYPEGITPEVSRGWSVTSVNVSVPETLTVSEANRLAPDADIVWRGEPAGDRRAQVGRIISEAAAGAVAPLRGPRDVALNIEVTQFHALSERARAVLSDAGVHNIAFTARIVDAQSGAPLSPPAAIRADLPGLVGEEAERAVAAGQTQRVRIVRHVTATIAGWLGTGPDVRGSFTRLGR